ncbi:MAG: choice-of-anchor I family protein [Ilumatobacteraceae bacterium]|nr:choice-of-anchor I family protein [Ilumatobacteraceae bacterium]
MKRTQRNATLASVVGLAFLFLPAIAIADAPEPSGSVTLTALGTYDGGGLARAEVVAYDASSALMAVSNDDLNRVDIIDISDPTSPALVTSVDMSEYGDGVNGVAAHNGVFVAGVERDPSYDETTGVPTAASGVAVFFNADGEVSDVIGVGVLPDSLGFSPDGRKVVVAGEGEPLCATDALGGGEEEDIDLATDPAGTIAVISLNSDGEPHGVADVLGFDAFDTAALKASGVRIFWPGSDGSKDLEPEYVTVSSDSSTAYVTLQEANAIAVVDLDVPEITDVWALGTKDFSNLLMDASNRDDGINLQNWDVRGIYMPDAIDNYTVNGATYLVTANEGDSRDYDCYSEEERMADLDYTGSTLSADVLADAGDETLLGRLNSTTAMPTSDPIDQLYMWGARSFTIWTTDGEVAYDPGSEFEEYIAKHYPDYFNANADDELATAEEMIASMADEVDARSDDKGVEPEGLAVGRIGSRYYAFVALERQGGVMVYDITNPTDGHFESYVNLALDEHAAGGSHSRPGTKDVSPEGVKFVSASDSPTSKPLVLVSNELSGTTTIYEVTGSEIDAELAVASVTLPATGSSPQLVVIAFSLLALGLAALISRQRTA